MEFSIFHSISRRIHSTYKNADVSAKFTMEIDEFRQYCLQKPETSESFPFDEDTLVFKVAGKMFALTSLSKWEAGDHSINLKCDPDLAIELREKYPQDVLPGYHMHKKHWNTVTIVNSALSEKYIRHLISHSYELVVSKMPKKKRNALREQYPEYFK